MPSPSASSKFVSSVRKFLRYTRPCARSSQNLEDRQVDQILNFCKSQSSLKNRRFVGLNIYFFGSFLKIFVLVQVVSKTEFICRQDPSLSIRGYWLHRKKSEIRTEQNLFFEIKTVEKRNCNNNAKLFIFLCLFIEFCFGQCLSGLAD